MARFALFILFILILGFVLQSFLPWWSIVILVSILAYLFNLAPGITFIAGFLGVFALWAGYAAYLNAGNEGILASRIGALFGGLSPLLLVLITGLIGGIFGGLGALVGKWGKDLVFQKA